MLCTRLQTVRQGGGRLTPCLIVDGVFTRSLLSQQTPISNYFDQIALTVWRARTGGAGNDRNSMTGGEASVIILLCRVSEYQSIRVSSVWSNVVVIRNLTSTWQSMNDTDSQLTPSPAQSSPVSPSVFPWFLLQFPVQRKYSLIGSVWSLEFIEGK